MGQKKAARQVPEAMAEEALLIHDKRDRKKGQPQRISPLRPVARGWLPGA
jgi:hypothetical protein